MYQIQLIHHLVAGLELGAGKLKKYVQQRHHSYFK
jgi:hypothetical protein